MSSSAAAAVRNKGIQQNTNNCLQTFLSKKGMCITILVIATLGIGAMIALASPAVNILSWKISLGVSLALVVMIVGGAISLRRTPQAPAPVSNEFGKKLVGISETNLVEMGLAARKLFKKFDYCVTFKDWINKFTDLDSLDRKLTKEEWLAKLKTDIGKGSYLRDYLSLEVIQELADKIAEGLEKCSSDRDPLNIAYDCFMDLDDSHLGGMIYSFSETENPGLKAIYEKARESLSLFESVPGVYYDQKVQLGKIVKENYRRRVDVFDIVPQLDPRWPNENGPSSRVDPNRKLCAMLKLKLPLFSNKQAMEELVRKDRKLKPYLMEVNIETLAQGFKRIAPDLMKESGVCMQKIMSMDESDIGALFTVLKREFTSPAEELFLQTLTEPVDADVTDTALLGKFARQEEFTSADEANKYRLGKSVRNNELFLDPKDEYHCILKSIYEEIDDHGRFRGTEREYCVKVLNLLIDRLSDKQLGDLIIFFQFT